MERRCQTAGRLRRPAGRERPRGGRLNCPHPRSGTAGQSGPVELVRHRAPAAADDPCRDRPRLHAPLPLPTGCTHDGDRDVQSSAARSRRCGLQPRRAGRATVVAVLRAGQGRCTLSTSRASRRSTRCSTAPTIPRSRQRPGHHARAGLGYVRAGDAADLQQGPHHGSHRRRHLRAATTPLRGAARARAMPCASASRPLPARLQGELHLELPRHGLGKRDIVANLNFFMNVPIDPSGNFTVDRRHLGWRQPRRHRGRDGRDLRDLQLPAGEQSVQRLQPNAGARPRLGPASRLMG